ncbi:hypothetical protein LTR94_036527, partial [Friedmanniomyces endolithicus]
HPHRRADQAAQSQDRDRLRRRQGCGRAGQEPCRQRRHRFRRARGIRFHHRRDRAGQATGRGRWHHLARAGRCVHTQQGPRDDRGHGRAAHGLPDLPARSGPDQ